MPSPSPSVLAVVNNFPSPSETFIGRKLAGLSQAGFDVQVAAATFGPEAAATGFDLVPLVPWKDPTATARSLTTGAGRQLVRREIEAARRSSALSWRRRMLVTPLAAARADIVHFEFSGIAVGYRDLLDQLRPARIAVSCRGSGERTLPLSDPTRPAALREVFTKADLIHCVSDDIRAIVEGFGAPADKIVVNRPAVDVATFASLRSERPAPDGPLRILSIGRLHWYKGFDDGLRAVQRIRDGGVPVEYHIAGDGPDRDKLEFLRQHLALTDEVTVLGTQTQAQIKDELTWANVFFLPSLSEGISNAVLEAMASGLPVVSTDCGGMPEVITSGKDGILVPVGDVGAMADQLAALAADPDSRARLGAAAFLRAEAEFDLSRQIQVFVDAYREILDTPG